MAACVACTALWTRRHSSWAATAQTQQKKQQQQRQHRQSQTQSEPAACSRKVSAVVVVSFSHSLSLALSLSLSAFAYSPASSDSLVSVCHLQQTVSLSLICFPLSHSLHQSSSPLSPPLPPPSSPISRYVILTCCHHIIADSPFSSSLLLNLNCFQVAHHFPHSL